MLVITRRAGDRLQIGDDITVTMSSNTAKMPISTYQATLRVRWVSSSRTIVHIREMFMTGSPR